HGSTSKTPSYTKSVSWHHYPSLTGARPAPGQFTATATITVEIVR
ncbi:transposase, partial [Escherichia coli]